jgi:glycosyltransferase involved in cell wall biosynthesis
VTGRHNTAAATRLPRVVFCNWRDLTHPEGGGSERYVERTAVYLARQGHDVTILCAAHHGAPHRETRDGITFRRGGGKLTVYVRTLVTLASLRLARHDVVIDVQNGIPFAARLVTRARVVVLVHHVHREQWRVIYGPLIAGLGWWIESRVSPWLYRRHRYVTVSAATAAELAYQGIAPDRVTVIHGGVDPAGEPSTGRTESPRICVLGRLVPHKRVEQVVDVVARLRDELPDIQLDVVGAGYWEFTLQRHAERAGVAGRVTFHGFLTEEAKQRILSASWVLAVPSLKEGWGLCITEAAQCGVPAVAYRSSGGVTESIHDTVTGLLADTTDEFRSAILRILTDDEERTRLGSAARATAAGLTWESTGAKITTLVRELSGSGNPAAVRNLRTIYGGRGR